jgi:hypothetical protein
VANELVEGLEEVRRGHVEGIEMAHLDGLEVDGKSKSGASFWKSATV